MPYPLKKPLHRKTEKSYNVLWASKRKARQIVVSLIPGGASDDLISFRELGTRKPFTLTVEACFKVAVQRAAFVEAARKRAEKTAKKKGLR